MDRSAVLTRAGALAVVAVALVLVASIVAASLRVTERPNPGTSAVPVEAARRVTAEPTPAARVGDAAQPAAEGEASPGQAAPETPVEGATTPHAGGSAPSTARGSVPPDAVALLPGLELAAPQAYRCVVDVLGWQDAAGSVACLRVLSAELAGAIDPLSGSELDSVQEEGPDHSARLKSLAILASVPGRRLEPGDRETVRVVLFPSGSSTTFFVDDSGE